MLQSDMGIALQQFNTLLNDTQAYMPMADTALYLAVVSADTTGASAHPQLRYQTHIANATKFRLKTERSRLVPDILLGYNNMSIIGQQNVNGQDVYFNAGKRFSSASVGLGIPLFFGAQLARINAAKVNYLRAQNDVALAAQQLNSERLAAQQQVQKHRASVEYYTTTGLKNAATIIATANRQFATGDIDYLQYTMLLNQGIGIQGEYLGQLQLLNQAIIKLETLSVKN
jgi:cobalt-zinc-cadmium resistance protein CzcA